MSNATITVDELIPIMNIFANQLLQLLGFSQGTNHWPSNWIHWKGC